MHYQVLQLQIAAAVALMRETMVVTMARNVCVVRAFGKLDVALQLQTQCLGTLHLL
jgi:hypothetical protein